METTRPTTLPSIMVADKKRAILALESLKCQRRADTSRTGQFLWASHLLGHERERWPVISLHRGVANSFQGPSFPWDMKERDDRSSHYIMELDVSPSGS